MELTELRPPSIDFQGRLWPSDELAARAAGWLAFVHDSLPPAAGLTAIVLSNHPDAVALFFALSSLPLPVVVLAPDVRTWRSAPPLPAGTPIFLPPQLHDLEGAGNGLGLRTLVARDPCPPARGTIPPFMTTPGIVEFTSGSTDLPKPVHVLTRSLLLQMKTIARTCGLEAGADVAGGLPLATPMGLVRNLLMPAFLGSTLGLLERFDHRAMLRLFASRPYAHWMATPLMVDMVARAPLAGPTPAVPPSCHIGTGKLAERVFHEFRRRFGVPPRPGYGLTENGAVTVEMAPDEEIRPTCVGRAYLGNEVRVGDDPLDPYPPGSPGRVWFTSPWYMEGYGFPPALVPREGRAGWWQSPDIGILDASGYLTLVGRADDRFKTASGHLVNPAEIADVLASHPGVTDVVVLPVPSGAEGMAVAALVEGDGITAEALRATAAHGLPGWLRPRVLVVTERLPRLPGGKPDRAACGAILREAGT